VTCLALGAEYAFVIVVFLVAGNAISLKFVLDQVARMAALALDGFMLVDQRVFGITVMVEGNLLPIIFRMTGDAFLSEVAFVCVVFSVAGQAL
jgi:hypothetical protein